MKRVSEKFLFLACITSITLLAFRPEPAPGASAVFGGGPFYSGGASVMNALRSSGFTTVILWCIHVDASTGNLILNDQLVVANGAYVGNAAWPGQLATLRTAPTSVNRIEVSVGSWGVNDFQSIQTLMNSQGTNTTSILYRNFLALKTVTGAAAVDFDDETLYDVTTTVKFGRMLSSIGYKLTLCPYTNPAFWQSVYSQLGNAVVDAVYLQCYAGGAGNNPSSWNSYFGGMKVTPGLWCAHGTCCAEGDTPASVSSKILAWKNAAAIPGGFMWLYDDMLSCSSRGTAAGYAAAINQAVDPLQISPATGFSAVAGSNGQFLPASTRFTLTNTGTATLNWSLVKSALWLSTSAGAGSLGSHGSASVTVSLNAANATNLPAGQYSATAWFTNLTTGVASPRIFTLNTAVTNWPVTVSEFNAALLAPNTATPAAPGATAFDLPNNYCFYQAGLSGGTRGLPFTGSFASLCDNRTAFALGAYGTVNALLLGYNYPKSATVTLSRPQAFNSLAVLACSANGGGLGSLVLNFTNGARSTFSFNAQDWFYTVTNVALQGFGRLKLGTSFTFEDNGDLNPNLYQTTLRLASLGLTNPIGSITFSMPANAGAQQNTAIFALSGNAVVTPPAPPTVTALLQTNGTVRLIWEGGGTLLEATNLAGPWTTNGSGSPVPVNPALPQMFYRVRTQ
ncbi:MAG TPA: lysyl endopeptidase [Verrucomicrobiae bacterium]